MTELSGFWSTNSGTSATGHQQASYTQAQWSIAAKILGACSGYEGVSPGYRSELAPSSTGANNVRIAAGGALVDGKWYDNDANIDKTIDSATAGNTRIDRVVVRCTWADYHAEVYVITGTNSGSPTAPAIASTSGTSYDIQICQVLVDEGGVITITDERKWAIVDTDESTLEDNAGLLRVKDGGITAAKIANRTRKFLAPATAAYNDGRAADVARTTQVGFRLEDGYLTYGFAEFIVPQDFVSTLTVAPVFYPTIGSGNIYYKSDATYGAAGEAYNVHSTLGSYAAVAGATDDWMVGTALSLSSAAINDYVTMRFYRDASHANDTYGDFAYFLGFLVSYTADS